MSTAAAKAAGAALERYRSLFEARALSGNALTQWRRAALDEFLARGFPTQRDEDWKYTSIRRFEARTFAPAPPTPVAVDESGWIQGAGARIVLVNGHAMAALSTASPLPPGVTVATLGHWLASDPDRVAQFLREQRHTSPSAFELFNAAFFDDGVVIDIGDGVRLDQPVYIVHQVVAGNGMSHPRILLRSGRDSEVTLIEHYIGAADSEYLTNAVISLELAAGASVSHYRLQQESLRSFHFGTLSAHLDRGSRYVCRDVALGGSLARTQITATLAGTGAEATLQGLFAPGGTQHIDTYTLVDHAAPHTVSTEEYRGVADGRGRGVYRGKVIVRKGAQKIDSRQSSRNLLLSPTAEIDTRPELEIYANDVKCSHGATTGQLDPASLFYLRSRGLSEGEARALLIRAFAESILSNIALQPLRQHLERQLNARFDDSETHS